MQTSRHNTARNLEMSEVKAATRDPRVWCEVGVVTVLDGDSQHYEFLTDTQGNKVDVLVGVTLAHSGEPMHCRLGMAAGRLGGLGIWVIPPAGTEVAVMLPHGEYESDGVIVAMLSSGGVPASLDDSTIVIQNAKNVHIESTDGNVTVDAHGKVSLQTAGGGAQPVARKTDPVDGGYLVFTPAVGAGVTSGGALTWAPPGVAPIVTPPVTVVPMGSMQVKDGSSKTESG